MDAASRQLADLEKVLIDVGRKVAAFARTFEEERESSTIHKVTLHASVKELEDILNERQAGDDAERYCAVVVIAMQMADVLLDASLVAEEAHQEGPPDEMPDSSSPPSP